ncbi:MAG TPA: hypothetical protein VHV51_02845, partial [Polyangiaceae bacterium]|nr:hypothetical protein [Polyangiaceae bacterium]
MNSFPRLRLSRVLSAVSMLPAALLLSAGCSSSNGASDDSSGAGTTSSGGHAGTSSTSGGTASSNAGANSGGTASSNGGATSSAGASNAGSTGTSGGATGIGGTTSNAGASSGGANAGASGSGGSGQAGAASGDACMKSNATCSGSNTGCNVGDYYLYDNQWNCAGNHCGPESAYGCLNSDGSVSWVATSNQPTGNTAVLTYPAIQSNFDSKPKLSSFNSISATFSETSPQIGDYEVAWDCWFNDNDNELMIWVDTYKQVPGGKKVATAVMLGGHSYDVWYSPGSGTGGYLAFYANQTISSGTIDLLELFKYAVTNNWLPASSVVNQLSF